MRDIISNGVYPTMITPFLEDGSIDYEAVEKVVEWYISNGVDGIFAVCQSSEMFYLSLEERIKLAKFVVKTVAGRVSVVASGHISDEYEGQVREINSIGATGVDAVVLISNKFAGISEGEDIFIKNMKKLLDRVDTHLNLGIYECPYPQKRLLSDKELDFCAKTERFLFIKDTCCDVETIERRLNVLKGTNVKLFNANSVTLLDTLKLGAAGFSGVMANFHPSLYTWLTKNYKSNQTKAEMLQSFLGIASLIEHSMYPAIAKVYFNLQGIPMNTYTRNGIHEKLNETFKTQAKQLLDLQRQCIKLYNLE